MEEDIDLPMHFSKFSTFFQSTSVWNMSLTNPLSPARGVAQKGQMARNPWHPWGMGTFAQYLRRDGNHFNSMLSNYNKYKSRDSKKFEFLETTFLFTNLNCIIKWREKSQARGRKKIKAKLRKETKEVQTSPLKKCAINDFKLNM